MAQARIALPADTSLRLQIAFLERDLALAQAQLLRHSAEQQHTVAMYTLLAQAGITLPVALTQCSFAPELGALLYDDGLPAQAVATMVDGNTSGELT